MPYNNEFFEYRVRSWKLLFISRSLISWQWFIYWLGISPLPKFCWKKKKDNETKSIMERLNSDEQSFEILKSLKQLFKKNAWWSLGRLKGDDFGKIFCVNSMTSFMNKYVIFCLFLVMVHLLDLYYGCIWSLKDFWILFRIWSSWTYLYIIETKEKNST